MLFRRNLIRMGAEALVRQLGEGARISAPDPTWRLVNLAAVAFFVAAGALNLWVVDAFDTETWVNIKTFGYPLLNMVFMGVLVAWLWRHVEVPEQASPGRDREE